MQQKHLPTIRRLASPSLLLKCFRSINERPMAYVVAVSLHLIPKDDPMSIRCPIVCKPMHVRPNVRDVWSIPMLQSMSMLLLLCQSGTHANIKLSCGRFQSPSIRPGNNHIE